jgi:hypothetical protein
LYQNINDIEGNLEGKVLTSPGGGLAFYPNRVRFTPDKLALVYAFRPRSDLRVFLLSRMLTAPSLKAAE